MTRNGNFADRMKEIMEERNYSYAKLGELLNMNPQTLNRYVLGSRIPKADVAVEIAKTLGVEPLWLLGFDVPKSSPQTPVVPQDTSEAVLLGNFRALNPDGKTKAIAYSYALLGLYPADAAEEIAPETPQPDADTPEPEAEFEPISLGGGPVAPEETGKAVSPEEINALCRESAKTYEMELVELKFSAPNLILCVKPISFWDEDSFISISCRYAACICSRLYRASGVDSVFIFFQTEMVDNLGNESLKNGLTVMLPRSGFQDQEDLEQIVASNYNLIFKMAEEYYIHPAIKSKLKQFMISQ